MADTPYNKDYGLIEEIRSILLPESQTLKPTVIKKSGIYGVELRGKGTLKLFHNGLSIATSIDSGERETNILIGRVQCKLGDVLTPSTNVTSWHVQAAPE